MPITLSPGDMSNSSFLYQATVMGIMKSVWPKMEELPACTKGLNDRIIIVGKLGLSGEEDYFLLSEASVGQIPKGIKRDLTFNKRNVVHRIYDNVHDLAEKDDLMHEVLLQHAQVMCFYREKWPEGVSVPSCTTGYEWYLIYIWTRCR